MTFLDPVLNFAKVDVSTLYNDTDVTIVLSAGEGAKLPDPTGDGDFNLVWWNSEDYPDPSDDPNVEIVRCTNRATNTLTVTRAQESTSATTKNTSGKQYEMMLTFTAKSLNDIDVHNHDAMYYTESEIDSTLGNYLLLANIDDIAVDGITNAPISSNWAYDHENNVSNPHSVTQGQVGLTNVEDTALSTWAGTSNVITVGDIIAGRTALTSGLVSTDELLVSDAGVIKKMDVSVLTDYTDTLYSASGHNHDSDYVDTDGDTMTGDLILNDNVDLYLGTDSDLQIFHNGTYSYVQNANSTFYVGTTTANSLYFVTANSNRWYVHSSGGHLIPNADSTYNIGTTSVRVATGYFDDLEVTSTIQFTPMTAPAHSEGLLFYDANNFVFKAYNAEADVAMDLGEELWKRVRNQSGSTILNGQPVYITGATGQFPLVGLTDASSSATARFAGLATHDIENNSYGYITIAGIVRDVVTTGTPESETWLDGDPLYLSETVGELTNVRPSSAYVVQVGIVDYSHGVNGKIEIQFSAEWFADMRVNDIYLTNDLYVVDNGRIEVGTGNDLSIYHNTTNSYIENATGSLVIKTTSASAIYFNTDNNNRWFVNSTGNFIPNVDSTYHIGSSSVRVATGYFDDLNIAGNISVSGGNISIDDSDYFYVGTGNDLSIFHNGSASYIDNANSNLYIGTTTTNSLYFRTGNSNRWYVNNGGHFVPNADSTYDIGADALRVQTGYFDNVNVGLFLYLPTNTPTDMDTLGDTLFFATTLNTAANRPGDWFSVVHFGIADNKDIQLASIYNNTPDGEYYLRGRYDSDGVWHSWARVATDKGMYLDDSKYLNIGTGNDLQILHDGTNSIIQNTNGILIMRTTTASDMYLGSSNTHRWNLTSSGHFVPFADSSYNIGSSSLRVQTGNFDGLRSTKYYIDTLTYGQYDDLKFGDTTTAPFQGWSDAFQGRSYQDVEYWNVSSWDTWSQSLDNLFDNNPATGVTVTTDKPNIRFTVNSQSWFGGGLLNIYQEYATTHKGYDYTVEKSADGSTGWSTIDTGTVVDGKYQHYMVNLPHAVEGYWRITLDFGTLTVNQSLRWCKALTSRLGYGVRGGHPFTYNYAGDVSFDNHIDLGDNKYLYLGASNDLYLHHDGVNSNIRNTTGNLYIGNDSATTFYFRTNNISRWYVSSVGDFIPASDSTYDIGATSLRVATGYFDSLSVAGNISVSGGNVSIDDSDYFYAGTGNDLQIYHDATNSFIENSTGILVVRTTSASDFYLGSNSTHRWNLNSSGHFVPFADSTYDIGTTSVRVATGYFDDLNLSNDLYVADNGRIEVGTGNDLSIYHDGANSYAMNSNSSLYIGTATSNNFYMRTNNSSRWVFNTSGHFIPVTDSTYDIGTASARVATGYFDTLDVGGNIVVSGTVDGLDVAGHQHKFMYSHSYTVPGVLATGDLISFFVPVMAGTTVKVTEVRYKTLTGTCTVTLKKNGTGLTGFTSMSVTTTATSTDAADQTLADNDYLNIDIDAISSGEDLTVSIYMEVTSVVGA